MSLRIALFGTGNFALPVFRSLLTGQSHQVVAVGTQPDRTGRGHHRHINPVKELAVECGVPVLQPANVNQPDVLDQLRALDADLFLVAAYGQILKQTFLDIPRLGAFNLHGSLLPRHRGAAPVQYAIWKGDPEGGVTLFRIEPALDSGPMVAKVATPIGASETSGELMARLAELCIDLTHEALQKLEAGTAEFEVQDEQQVTLAPKIKKQDGAIDWHQSAAEIDCQIRAMQPWPKAYSWLSTSSRKPLRCILLDAEPVEAASNGNPGSVELSDGDVYIHCGSGRLRLQSVQPEGRKPMDAAGFANGFQLADGGTFRPE